MTQLVIETLYGPIKVKEDEYFLARESFEGDGSSSSTIGYYQKMKSGNLHEEYSLAGNLTTYKKVSKDMLFRALRKDRSKGIIKVLEALEKKYMPNLKTYERVDERKSEEVKTHTGLEVMLEGYLLPTD